VRGQPAFRWLGFLALIAYWAFLSWFAYRDHPLLVVLDEPTAAFDSESEHALFERYPAAARGTLGDDGLITIQVSHRFSTVRMADLIVVLDGARVAEIVTHEELMARGGSYA
jgi:ATP-binding cassette subfamily B protein